MNSLSWFIYAADVLPNFSWMGGVCFITLILFTLVTVIVSGSCADEGPDLEKFAASFRGSYLKIAPFLIVLTLFSFLIPSKETIYLIAGSEAGETVVTSEAGQEMLNDIHSVIKHQLSTLKGETGEEG